MNERQYKNLAPVANKVSKKMVNLAVYAVDRDIKTSNGDPLDMGARSSLIAMVTYSMALGENLTKRKYFMKGVVIGTVITGVVCATRNVYHEMKTKDGKESK